LVPLAFASLFLAVTADVSGVYTSIRKELANPMDTAKLMDATSDPNYPSLTSIPSSSTFSCADQAQPGLYADVSTKCQVFYQCQGSGRQYGYLCQSGTAFNQMTLACDYYYNVQCDRSPQLYAFSNLRTQLDSSTFDDCYKSCAKEKCSAT